MKVKKIIAIALSAALAISPLSAHLAVRAAAPSVKLSKASLSLAYGGSATLKIVKKNVKKADGFKAGKWTVSNKKVLSVTKSGKVTAIGDGKATVTFSYTLKGKAKKANCKVTVAKPGISDKSVNMQTDGTYTLEISGTKKPVTWSSSDESVATVSGGKVTASSKGGEVTITATIDKKYTLTCKVRVYTEAEIEEDPDIDIDDDSFEDDEDFDEDDEDDSDWSDGEDDGDDDGLEEDDEEE